MKRILMLDPVVCGSGDFTKNRIYNIEDKWIVFDEEKGEYTGDSYDYSEEISKKYTGDREIYLTDDSNVEDSFQIYDDEERFILFDNDKYLARKLIDTIEGLDTSIINMVLALYNNIPKS